MSTYLQSRKASAVDVRQQLLYCRVCHIKTRNKCFLHSGVILWGWHYDFSKYENVIFHGLQLEFASFSALGFLIPWNICSGKTGGPNLPERKKWLSTSMFYKSRSWGRSQVGLTYTQQRYGLCGYLLSMWIYSKRSHIIDKKRELNVNLLFVFLCQGDAWTAVFLKKYQLMINHPLINCLKCHCGWIIFG